MEIININRLLDDLDSLYGSECFNYDLEQSHKLAKDIKNLIIENQELKKVIQKYEKKLFKKERGKKDGN